MRNNHYLFFIFFIFSFLLAKVSSGNITQGGEVVDISILNKDEDVIMQRRGLVVDIDGVIFTNSVVIEKWLEDVQNTLIVKIKNEDHRISKLIYFNKKKDIAIFSVSEKEVKRDRIQQILKRAETIKKVLNKDSKVTDSFKKEDEDKKEGDYQLYKKDFSDFQKEALALFKKGKYSDAIELYKRLIGRYPDLEMYNRLGVLYILTNNYSEAINILEEAKNIDSKNVEIYFNLGISYFLSGNKEKVFEYYLILNRLCKEKADELFEFAYR